MVEMHFKTTITWLTFSMHNIDYCDLKMITSTIPEKEKKEKIKTIKTNQRQKILSNGKNYMLDDKRKYITVFSH